MSHTFLLEVLNPDGAQGLPVFYSPGEAEATCAALVRAGWVDAAASFDSDTLVHGAERVYHTLKLSVRSVRPARGAGQAGRQGGLRSGVGLPLPGRGLPCLPPGHLAGNRQRCAPLSSPRKPLVQPGRTPPPPRPQTLKPSECELVSCDLGDIRGALGIQRGGQAALSVIAMLAGSGVLLPSFLGGGIVRARTLPSPPRAS